MKAVSTCHLVVLLLAPLAGNAALVTFDNVVDGQTSYAVDVNGDGTPDVVFSTTDPAGFRAAGPGTNQRFINEPGLEGSASQSPAMRVDFPRGAIAAVAFGFAVDSFRQPVPNALDFTLFDARGQPIASTTANAEIFDIPGAPGVTSDFAENAVNLAFSGVASFGLFDFNASRFIIDNFQFTPAPPGPPGQLPEPGSLASAAAVFLVLLALLRRARSGPGTHRRER